MKKLPGVRHVLVIEGTVSTDAVVPNEPGMEPGVAISPTPGGRPSSARKALKIDWDYGPGKSQSSDRVQSVAPPNFSSSLPLIPSAATATWTPHSKARPK